MADANIEAPRPVRKTSGTVSGSRPPPPACRSLPTIAAVLGHADIATTAIYTTAVGVEARDFLTRMWAQEAESRELGV